MSDNPHRSNQGGYKKSKESAFIKTWWPTIVVLMAILWLTLAPHPIGDESITLFPGADKLVHAIMFGGLATTWLFDYYRMKGLSAITLPVAALAGIVCGLLGVGIEYLQELMDVGRGKEFLDMVADMGGAIVAAMIYLLISRWMLLHSHSSNDK